MPMNKWHKRFRHQIFLAIYKHFTTILILKPSYKHFTTNLIVKPSYLKQFLKIEQVIIELDLNGSIFI